MANDNTGADSLPGVSTLDLSSELAGSRERKPWHSGLFSKVLFKTGDLRLILIAMEAGAKMKEHHAEGSVSIQALQGTMCVHVQGQAHDLRAEQILTLAPGIKHDVEAREDASFLLTIASPGSDNKPG